MLQMFNMFHNIKYINKDETYGSVKENTKSLYMKNYVLVLCITLM